MQLLNVVIDIVTIVESLYVGCKGEYHRWITMILYIEVNNEYNKDEERDDDGFGDADCQ